MKVFRNIENLPAFRNAVLTIGSFDGVHFGHQKILERLNQIAREIDGESVLITFDPHPREVIYPKDNSLRLLTTQIEKVKLLERYKLDNLVVVPFSVEFSQISSREYVEKFLLERFQPSYLVIGYDHRFGLNRHGNVDLLRQYEKQGKFKLIEIAAQEIEDITLSSSKIRTALFDGHLDLARRLLNHSYLLTGQVVHGEKLGSKLGFPTANLQLSHPKKLIPKEGIYAVEVETRFGRHEGMMYIGIRPTINTKQERVIEINLFDFDEDIYDEKISIDLVEYIRDDEKFEKLEDLQAQLRWDANESKRILKHFRTQNIVKPQIAIAILNYNGKEYLESYLPLVLNSGSVNFDIYVIDNASDDDSIAYLEEWHPEVNIIRLNQNYGFADGYNKGIEHITAEYTVILNSDVKVSPKWIDPLLEWMNKEKRIACLQPKIKSLEEQEKFEYAGASGGFMDSLGYLFCRGRIFNIVEEDTGQYDQPKEIFWTCGAAMIIRTQLFKNFGGFDPDYFAHQEEADLCWRLKTAGYQIKCIPESVVYHLGGGTLPYANPKKTYLNFRNSLFNLFKNEKPGQLIWKLPVRFLMDLMTLLYFLLRYEGKNSLAVLRANVSFIIQIPALIKKRKMNKMIISKNKIGKPNTEGRFNASIVWHHFVLRKENFKDLKFK